MSPSSNRKFLNTKHNMNILIYEYNVEHQAQKVDIKGVEWERFQYVYNKIIVVKFIKTKVQVKRSIVSALITIITVIEMIMKSSVFFNIL